MNGKVKGVSDGNYKGFKIVSIERSSFQDVLAGSSFFNSLFRRHFVIGLKLATMYNGNKWAYLLISRKIAVNSVKPR
jgi:hypothetical protein